MPVNSAAEIYHHLTARNWSLSLAESMSAGAMSFQLVAGQPGISKVYKGGMNVYSEQAKRQLGVPQEVLDLHRKSGHVSKETTEMLAIAANVFFESTVAVAITGYSILEQEQFPQCFIAIAWEDKIVFCNWYTLKGDRIDIMKEAADTALVELVNWLRTLPPIN